MRLDRDHPPGRTDMPRQHHRVDADIGTDIDEYTSRWRIGAEEIQFLKIVAGIEQRAALGRACLVIESERSALIMCIDRPGSKQVDQARQHRAERTSLQTGAM